MKSNKNELLLNTGGKWAGQGAATPEVAIFFDDKVWSLEGLPNGFDLSKAVIVSFEGEKIRFFDFGKLSGGYYKREKSE